MRNKLLIYISIFIAILYFFSCKNEVKEEVNEKITMEINEKDFHITKDETENIDKIIMSDKAGNIIKLEKKEVWTINNKYPAWKWRIEYLLDIMRTIRIKSSVSEAMTKYAIENIATKGVKVEIFEGEKRIKSYYVGGNNKNHNGTYMMIENANNIYVMHIPTKAGDHLLTEKYFIQGGYINETLWREPITININPIEISEVKVIDFINKNQSYTMNIENKKLTDSKNNEILIDNRKYNSFASCFSNLTCGTYKPDLNPEDFILSKKIYITNNSKIDSLIIYDKTKMQKTQKEFSPNVEYLYAKWNNSDMVIIQKNIFNKVLITLDEIKK